MKTRILVVEDESFTAQLLSETLVRENFEVVGPVATVAEATDLAATEQIDAALLDVALAGETTFDLARRLRDMNVPVVFNSGRDRRDSPADLADIPLCPKPSNPVPLVAAVTAAR